MKEEQSVFEPHLSHPGGRCYTSAMPPEWSQRCDTFFFVWAKGSEGEMFPSHVGSAIGEKHGGATYFMFEVHYDNPGLETFVDSSGVKLFYTDQLREHEGAVIMLGHRVTPFLLISPKQPSFTTRAVCSKECTEMTFPQDGINIIHAMLHGHIYAKKIKLGHVRNGTEMNIVAQDDHYEFNYQQSRVLSKEFNVLPGDQLTVECDYDTAKSHRVVLGGLASSQEMCNVFVFYYPKIDLMQCVSQPEAGSFFKAFGVNEVEGDVLEKVKIPYDPRKLRGRDLNNDLPDYAVELQESGDGESFTSFYDYVNVTNPEGLRRKSVGRLLKDIPWEKEEIGKQVQKSWKHGQHYAFCAGHGRKRHNLKNYKVSYPNIKAHGVQKKTTEKYGGA